MSTLTDQSIKHRIEQSQEYCHLYFPRSLRDGKVLQQYSQLLIKNENIKSITFGINKNQKEAYLAMMKVTLKSNLESFDLRTSELHSEYSKWFFQSIFSTGIKKLTIRVNKIQKDDIDLLNICLPYIEEFALHTKQISNKALQYLSECLKNNKKLIAFKFSCNVLPPESFMHLIKIPLYIQNFDISDLQLCRRGMANCMTHLAQWPNLTELTVGNNGFGSIQSLFMGLKDLPHLTGLFFSDKNMINTTSFPLIKVANGLKNTKIQKLHLPVTVISDLESHEINTFNISLSTLPLTHLKLYILAVDEDPSEKVTRFIKSLFNYVSSIKTLEDIHIEAIHDEAITYDVDCGISFGLLLNSLHELKNIRAPFVSLIKQHPKLLQNFANAQNLISTLDNTIQTENEKLQKIEEYKEINKTVQALCRKHVENSLMKCKNMKNFAASVVCEFLPFDFHQEDTVQQ